MSIVGYLKRLGHNPKKIRGKQYWYLSPLREEETPSFKVDDAFNVWFDHGIGNGGNLVDFGILYHRCSVQELLQKWTIDPFFQQPITQTIIPEKIERNESQEASKKSAEIAGVGNERSPLKILSVGEIEAEFLWHYIDSRKIPLYVASQFCKQVDFELYGKKNTALGFPNRSGGFELRNPLFKGSSSPKDISFLDHGKDQVSVFEGFFSFMSFVAAGQQQEPLTNFLVLNSLAYLEKSRSVMESHRQIDLMLDLDHAGIQGTKKALEWHPKYKDRSELYAGYKDLNDWIVGKDKSLNKGHRKGRHR